MKSSELLSQRSALVAQARQLHDQIKSESRKPSADEKTQLDKFLSDADNLKAEAEEALRSEKLEGVEAELRHVPSRKSAPLPGTLFGPTNDRDRKEALRSWALGDKNNADASYRAAQCGIDLHNPRLSLRALAKGSGSTGGYTVSTGFQNEINKALKWFANVRDFVRVVPTDSGNDLQWPTVTDVANSGATVAEAGAPATNVDPSFGQVVLKSQAYTSSIVKISTDMLTDAEMDVEELLGSLLGERLARKLALDYMTGAGGGTAPNGLITGAAVGVNLASSNEITFQKLKQLEHSVDIAYRRKPGVGFVMHDSTFAAIEQLADDNGRPLFLPNLSDGSQYRLFGYPVNISNDFPNYSGSEGDNKPMILFGDLQSFVIRDVTGSTEAVRFDELYRGNRQIGFMVETRAWCDYIGPSGCVKSLNSYDAA